jgi:hypothetical protein
MVRQAHTQRVREPLRGHERNQKITARPELVEGLVQNFPNFTHAIVRFLQPYALEQTRQPDQNIFLMDALPKRGSARFLTNAIEK